MSRPLLVALQGNFAVRLFSSQSSLIFWLGVGRRLPDCLVFTTAESDLDRLRAQPFGPSHLPQLVLGQGPGFRDVKEVTFRESGLHWIDADSAPSDVVRFLARLEGEPVPAGAFQLDSERLRVTHGPSGEAIDLSVKELSLLKVFLENPGRCLTREFLNRRVWDGLKVSPRTIDSHVSRLRRRLEKTNAHFRSIYGGGYVFSIGEEARAEP